MPEVSDLVVDVAPVLAVLALLRVFVRLPGRRSASSDHLPLPGEAADLRRIRMQVHDHTVQRLAALAWRAERIPGEAGMAVAEEVWAALEELRAIVLEDGAPARDQLDLLVALRGLADRRGAIGPPIHLMLIDRGRGRPTEVPAEVTEHAFRVAREAIGNAVRHGAATAVAVEASLGVDRLHLEVRDDGRGIDPGRMADARRHGHGGLGVMQDRATAVGARLAIESSGRGTQVTLDWRR